MYVQDGGFVPSQYEATPKQIFYHSMIALSKIHPGGGATMILPECFRRVKEMIRSMPPQEVGSIWTPECALPATRRFVRLACSEQGVCVCNGRGGAYSIGRGVEQRLRPMLDLGSGVEVLLDEGDLFVVDPMMLHAATPNTRGDIPGYSRCTAWARPRLRNRPR